MQHGDREHSVDEDGQGYVPPTAGAPQPARMTHSPHAAAASRRFLTPAAGASFYGAGTPRCNN